MVNLIGSLYFGFLSLESSRTRNGTVDLTDGLLSLWNNFCIATVQTSQLLLQNILPQHQECQLRSSMEAIHGPTLIAIKGYNKKEGIRDGKIQDIPWFYSISHMKID